MIKLFLSFYGQRSYFLSSDWNYFFALIVPRIDAVLEFFFCILLNTDFFQTTNSNQVQLFISNWKPPINNRKRTKMHFSQISRKDFSVLKINWFYAIIKISSNAKAFCCILFGVEEKDSLLGFFIGQRCFSFPFTASLVEILNKT